jgi:uridine phosphorylase
MSLRANTVVSSVIEGSGLNTICTLYGFQSVAVIQRVKNVIKNTMEKLNNIFQKRIDVLLNYVL